MAPAPSGAGSAIIDLFSIGRAIAALDGRGLADEFDHVAENIQRSLLSVPVPRIAGVDVGLRASPGRLAGGDYLDAIVLPEAPTVVGIGDVSGKSLPSALKSLSLKFAIRGLLRAEPRDLARVLAHANEVMGECLGPDEYVSTLLCSLPPSLDRLVYANAGHDPPLIFRPATGEIGACAPGGLVMGVAAGVRYALEEAPLEPGDIIVLYTDGFTDARNAAGEQFTLAQLKAGLRDLQPRGAQDLADALFERIEKFTAGTFRDDASIIVLRIVP